jgi:hypothetical protein
MTVRVRVGRQENGITYELAPKSREILEEHFSNDIPPASSVFVSHETKASFEALHGPVWKHVVGILSGLPPEQLEEIDEVLFEDPETSTILFNSRKADVR